MRRGLFDPPSHEWPIRAGVALIGLWEGGQREPTLESTQCCCRYAEGAIRIAAIQLEPAVGELAENVRRCRALADEAGAAGAEWIILPEFFTTGMGFVDAIAGAALPPHGAATQLMQELAARHRAVVGGSFICRDEDGHNRNRGFWSDRMPGCSAATTRTSDDVGELLPRRG